MTERKTSVFYHPINYVQVYVGCVLFTLRFQSGFLFPAARRQTCFQHNLPAPTHMGNETLGGRDTRCLHTRLSDFQLIRNCPAFAPHSWRRGKGALLASMSDIDPSQIFVFFNVGRCSGMSKFTPLEHILGLETGFFAILGGSEKNLLASL